ncbi:MAG: DNA-directed DNA polymerase III PolC [bacterium]|jgi:DNA-directed DNA polymerase III PolC
MSPKALLDEAEKFEIKRLALTDINSTSGSLYYAMEAQNRGVQTVLGVDFRNSADQKFIALAKTNYGYQKINEYLSQLQALKIDVPDEAPEIEDAFIVYPLFNAPKRKLRFNEYVGITPSDKRTWGLKNKTHFPDSKCVALQSVTFRSKRDFNTHRLLRAIDKNVLLSQLKTEEQGLQDHQFLTKEVQNSTYELYPHIIENTTNLLEQCNVHFDFNLKGKTQNKESFTGKAASDFELLKQMANDGLTYRFNGRLTKEINDRLEMELRVINQCGFVPYFLINQTIVNYARSKGYFYVGRGSGSNSLVAYLLRITNVNPIELDLYFERFINPNRKSPPDFDIDFSWRDRNDVTQFIFDTYPNTALLGSYITFQQKSVIREIGKVLGLPADEIKKLQHTDDPSQLDEITKLTIRYSRFIHGLPNHLSIHSSGIIITEKPIHYFGATSMPHKGFPTAHFDMHIAEDVGIHKYDILGQRGLGKIKDTLQIIKTNQPNEPEFDIDDIDRFKKDEKVKTLLRIGDSIGCFYVESPAMRGLMKKLEVDDYKGLVAASSIIRPGVSQSGMMQEYIKRHRNPSARAATHPILGEILNETYGVMVYQEDVLKVAHYFAGLTLEESDLLRRGMSWKFRERVEFVDVKDKFFSNCDEKGYPIALTKEIWRQIESFANYAFAKGHSASYAVESYQSLFLKAYYPLEYMVATVNNFGGFYSTEHYLQEARLNGAMVSSPCANTAEIQTTIQGKEIIIGFQHVKNLEAHTITHLIKERRKNGPFESIENFVDRVPVSLEMLIILIRTNAFRFTKKTKSSLLWKGHFMLGSDKKAVSNTNSLFGHENIKNVDVPSLEPMAFEDAYDEIEQLGFPLCSPFDLLEPGVTEKSIVADDFPDLLGKNVRILGYLVHRKRTTTRGRYPQQMMFGTFMDIKGKFYDSVHFPPSFQQYKITGKGIYELFGKISTDNGHHSIEVEKMDKLPYQKLVIN